MMGCIIYRRRPGKKSKNELVRQARNFERPESEMSLRGITDTTFVLTCIPVQRVVGPILVYRPRFVSTHPNTFCTSLKHTLLTQSRSFFFVHRKKKMYIGWAFLCRNSCMYQKKSKALMDLMY
jgi:hypothetical protein